MKCFSGLKTRSKLFLAFGAMTALLGIVIATAYLGISALQGSQKSIYEEDFANVQDLLMLRTEQNGVRAALRTMMTVARQADRDTAHQDIQDGSKLIAEIIPRLRERYRNEPRGLARIEEYQSTMAEFSQTRETVLIPLIFEGKTEQAEALARGVQNERYNKMLAIALELSKGAVEKAGISVAASESRAQQMMHVTIIVGVAAVLLAVTMALLLTRDIAVPLQILTTAAERIAVGDLNVNVPSDARSDEVGTLARAFGRMTQSLRAMAGAAEQMASGDLRLTINPQSSGDVLGNAFARMSEDLRSQIRELIDGANVLGSAASEIVASTAQLAASASESAAAVSETTTTVEEVRQTAQVASQKATQVSDSAQRSVQISQTGRKSAKDVGAGMSRIQAQMEAIAASMVRLSEQSQAIGQIIATVEDLAAQSNLLAVNAAIEAAKAGEQGKGFGVVAQEVKSLAEQSRAATNQVRMILTDIQKATTTAVMATEQGSKAVEAGAKQTEVASDAIQSLAASVNEAAGAASQIAVSSQQQLAGVDQVAGAMESIKQASAQNVAGAQQLETAARDLNKLGQRLKTMVERYQV